MELRLDDKITTIVPFALNMSNVNSGIYIVEIGNSKTKLTKKIIVK